MKSILVASSVLVAGGFALSQPAGHCAFSPLKLVHSDPSTFVDIAYDYIIIGGGTAGIVLAARLANDSNYTIGVIEAGSIHLGEPAIEVPRLAGQAIGNPLFDWKFNSTPQAHAGGRSFSIARGKLLGGSSAINSLAWTRASAFEYNSWSSFAPTRGWDWDDLFPFFRRSETIASTPGNPFPGISSSQAVEAANDFTMVNGLHGPINASLDTFYPSVVPITVKTLNSMGIPTNAEPQNGITAGVHNSLLSIDRRRGVRSYSVPGYLCSWPEGHTNLHILLNAQVTRILMDETNSSIAHSATGVEFSFASNTSTIYARKEVILSAGTVQTPQLLELSGIGNRSILEAHGIATLVDLPAVGQNLQEHLFAGIQWELLPGQITFDILRNNPTFAEAQMSLYNTTGTGIYANSDSTIAFLNLKQILTSTSPVQTRKSLLELFDKSAERVSTKPHSIKTLQFPIQRTYLEQDGVAISELAQFSSGFFTIAPNKSYITMAGSLLHPMSRGSVHIQGADPLAAPVINLGYLTEDFDAEILLNNLKLLIFLAKQPPLCEVIAAQVFPDPSTVDLGNVEDLLNFIKTTSTGSEHLIGTAALAPRDKGGVVDSSLRVYGIRNLRVVDASIIPLHVGAHIQSTVYAIAEKAADMIMLDSRS